MCRCILAACITFGFASTSFAQGAKPNTLTSKEIADGWILLFDGETTFGWGVQGPGRVENGQWLIGGGANALVKTNATIGGDGSLRIEFRRIGQKPHSGTLVFQGHHLSLPTFADEKTWTAELFEVKQGRLSRSSPSPGAQKTLLLNDPTRLTAGPVRFQVDFDGQLALRNIKYKPAATQSLFTAKDLSGWKVFPGKKSEFAVIDGTINIKNGPGDLQTEKKFGDFVLQLECISHGEHLNSGVFFRCRDGEYQNGYEAQIRNQFTDKPTQKYLLEEYDPESHKLLGKKEALFTAVDYGTGAIYRRQPARREVAKDNSWFTMTVVAHGNHLATWVNGIQVTDWYDNRPRSDNARTGCRLEAGHISLQGHDPTTNLSFKNFRIQEYPK